MKLHVCFVSLAAVASALGSLPIRAQAPAADDVIVVTGEVEEQAREKAKSYLSELGVAIGEQSTARWFDPICPRAIGVSKQHAAIVEEQIRQIVREAGAPLAKIGCDANFVIAFTDGPERVVKRIASSRGGLPHGNARALKEGSAPIRWWYHTELRSKDGVPASDSPLPFAQLNSPSYAPLPSGSSGSLTQYNSSMVSTQSVRAIHAVTVLVDVKRAEGMPLKSVIDYTALVGLAEIMLGASPSDSVLSLFQSGGNRELTFRDRAFLAGLYEIAMDRGSLRQRRAIVQAMVAAKEPN